MVEVVNVVGSGFLRREFDLSIVAEDLGFVAEFDPEKYPAIYIRFSDDAPLITVYRTGKFIITGAGSIKELHDLKSDLLNCLSGAGIVSEDDLEWFKVQNLVCTADLSDDLDLSSLAIALGLEHTEYEPEQFPCLIYRKPNSECVGLIFSTGKAVITGSNNINDVEVFLDLLEEKLSILQLN
jgi:transcription initiation factor TFIID TATA-box-binding protein